jgi:WhiB family redox-sensing transcriptional regulator
VTHTIDMTGSRLKQLLIGRWQTEGLCATPHSDANWFPDQHQAKAFSTRNAVAVCGQCPVRADCLDYALITESHRDRGIWGGLTHKQRTGLRSVMYMKGVLPVIRVCANPGCRKLFQVKSRNVPRTGVCCSNECRRARRRLRSRTATLNGGRRG